MFGHGSKPSRIYSYGALAPHENAALVAEQMRLAHRYRNALVERELARRAAVNALLREMSPDLVAVDAEIAAHDTRIEDLLSATKRANVEARARRASKKERTDIATAKAARKDAYARRKSLRAALFASSDFTDRRAATEAHDLAERKRLRAECGCYWGTYCQVEQAMQNARRGAPPRYKRWDGDGKIAVQAQGGMSIDEAMSCTDTRLRIEADPARSTPRRRRVIVHLRADSTDDGKPVWAQFRVTLHRELPTEARIKWIYAIRRRVACSEEWRIQFVLERVAGWPKRVAMPGRVCGIDLGWRILDRGKPTERVRVASLVDSSGLREELSLDGTHFARWRKSDELRAIRDLNFDAERDAFVEWMGEHGHAVPEWLLERTATLGQWRAPARLASLLIHWRSNRFDGDSAIFARMESWRLQDRHLYQWERWNVQKAIRQRNDIYRCFAARIAATHSEVYVEDCDWHTIAKIPGPEETDEHRHARIWRRVGAPGTLRQCLEEAGIVLREPAANTTLRCHVCGDVEWFDAARELTVECSRCLEPRIDQDERAARNLLASGSVAKATAHPLA